MKNYNLSERSIDEIIDIVKEYRPEMSKEDITSLSLNDINEIIITSISCIESEPEEGEGSGYIAKHCPSRKKRCKRIKKRVTTVKYRQKKREEEMYGKRTRRRVDCETTNRSYINKASKSFVPNRKFYSL